MEKTLQVRTTVERDAVQHVAPVAGQPVADLKATSIRDVFAAGDVTRGGGLKCAPGLRSNAPRDCGYSKPLPSSLSSELLMRRRISVKDPTILAREASNGLHFDLVEFKVVYCQIFQPA